MQLGSKAVADRLERMNNIWQHSTGIRGTIHKIKQRSGGISGDSDAAGRATYRRRAA